MARPQQWQVTYAQLAALGFTRRQIQSRSERGLLVRSHHGVFSVGRPASTPLERASAAVLACGQDAALSHDPGLTLWGMAKHWPSTMHVIVPRQRKRPGVRVHIVALTRDDIRTQLGIRVTSPARTVLDCAVSLGPKRLARVVADARRAGLLHTGQIQDVLERFPRHAGRALLAAQLTDHAPTRSEFEDLFVAFCARHGLPTPEVNVMLCGYEVDALFRKAALVIELDGYDFHRDRHAFESDRERDAQLLAAGIATLRLTWERCVQRPHDEARRIEAILSART